MIRATIVNIKERQRACDDDRSSPDGHAEEQPRLVLFVAFDRATSPQREQQVCLDDLDGFVAALRHAERKLPRQICQLRMKFWPFVVEFGGDSTD